MTLLCLAPIVGERRGARARAGGDPIPAAEGAGGRQAVAAPGRPTHTFPGGARRLVGRDQEIALVRERLLAAERGLLTLIGSGGCGKSSLALEIAREAATGLPDGAWVVELGALDEAALAPHLVAATLGVGDRAGRTPLDGLAAYLEPRRLLLVLDGCDHAREACARLADGLLRRCPGLWVLATCREPLEVAGEAVWRVASLAIPDPDRLPPLETLATVPAVRLFVERVAAAQPVFALSPRNAGAVARVCARLEGIPLALELAAGSVVDLPVEALAERLRDAFRPLVEGSRSTPSRQQTLQVTLEWCWALLSASEQATLRRLGTFAGWCGLEAAGEVCAGETVARAAVPGLLARLAQRGLVQAEEGVGGPRLRLLEPIRAFARARLEASGEAAAARARHLQHYLELAEQGVAEAWGERMCGPFGSARQLRHDARLGQEHDNLRVALAQAERQAGAETLARLCAALWPSWLVRGRLGEGWCWMERALARGAGVAEPWRARLLGGMSLLAWERGDAPRALALADESLALFRALGDAWNAAFVLGQRGLMAAVGGDLLGGLRALEASVMQLRELGDPWGDGRGLLQVGVALCHAGHVAQARGPLEEALALLRRAGDAKHGIEALLALGGVALEAGEVERAAELAREGLRLLRDTGLRWRLAEALGLAAAVASAEGVAEGRPAAERAVRLFGASEAAREARAATLEEWGEATRSRLAQAARSRLDPPTFGAAWAAGRRLASEQALAEALADEPAAALPEASPPRAIPAVPAAPTAAPVPSPSPRAEQAPAAEDPLALLSPREWEMIRLIARGRTNRQIATALAMAEGAVALRVHSILRKLDLPSRARLAAWAAEVDGLREGPPRRP